MKKILAGLMFGALVAPQIVFAQDATELNAPPPPPQAESLSVDADPIVKRYHEAFKLLAQGKRDAAAAELELIILEAPAHALAPRAQLLLGALKPQIAAQDKIVSGEQPTGLARGELVVVQTAHGIAIGAEVCMLFECDDSRAVVASLLLGGGLGLTASLLFNSEEGMTAGHTAALNSGTYWGAWQGAAALGIFEYDSTPAVAGTLLFTQLAGLAAGEIAYRTLQPTAGDVSMATSAGVWAGALTFFAHAANEFDASSQTVFASLLIASDLGLVAGAVASKYYPMSRSRSLVVDAGGMLGTLVGMGIPLLVLGEDLDAQVVFGGAGIGAITGLATSYYMTRNWDAPEDLADLQLHLMPVEGGATVGLGGVW